MAKRITTDTEYWQLKDDCEKAYAANEKETDVQCGRDSWPAPPAPAAAGGPLPPGPRRWRRFSAWHGVDNPSKTGRPGRCRAGCRW